MRTTEVQELLSTVEEIRRARYPDVPQEFVQAVVKAEDENPDAADALDAIARALDEALTRLGVR